MMQQAKSTVETLRAKGLTISAAESCTGGGFANALTNISGASEVLKESRVTYSNEAKLRLGVSKVTLARYSVYSTEVAFEMAFAASKAAGSDIGVGITGNFAEVDLYNPGVSKPGTVFIAVIYQHDGFPLWRDATIKIDTKLDRADAKNVVIERALRLVQGIMS